MEILTSEARAWMRAADVAGVELPDEIVEARRRLEKVEAQMGDLPEPEKLPAAAQLVAAGATLEEAAVKLQELTVEATKRAEARTVVREARTVAWDRLSRLVAEQRDALIVGARPSVDELIASARPLAAELEPFRPKYDAGDIARKANPKQVKAWREAEELERTLGTILAAWRASFQESIRLGGYASPSRVSGFDVREVDQVHRFWLRPEYVQNPRLAGTHLNRRGYPTAIAPDVLNVAAEPEEAGFQLRTVRELKEVYEEQRRQAREAGPQPMGRTRRAAALDW